MPDTEISNLPPLVASQIQDEDVLAIADLSATETKKVKAGDLVIGVLGNLPDGSIDPNKLDWANLDSGTISGDDIINASIADEKLFGNTLTSRVIAPNAIGASELADASVDTAALQVGAVDNGALGTNSVDNRVIQDGAISNANLVASSVTVDKLSLNADDLPGSVIANGTITPEELKPNLSGNEILDNSSIGTNLLEDGAVVNSKLAGNSVNTVNIIDNAVTAAKISSVDGSSVINSSITATKIQAASVSRGLNNNGANIGITNSVAAGTRNGIQWNSQGLITGNSALSAGDVPVATDSTVGGVSVPADGGLSVAETGALSINNSIVAGSVSGFTFDQHGSISNAAPLQGADLPPAKTTEIGAVSVPDTNSSPLLVNAAGALTHRLVTGGSASGLASVDIDDYGIVVAGSSVLVPSQVPSLDASKIATGTFPTARLANDSISSPKVADYATCLMQETFPGNSADYFLGMLWWQPSTSQLRVYSRGSAGNTWSPVGFGALQANNLRWGGVFDAAAGTVSIVTEAGTTAGLTAGAAIPAPSDELSGLYLICQTAGSNVNHIAVSSEAFTPGDWLLCVSEAEGYERIDSGASGGGGGGSDYLSQLLDVNISDLAEGERLEANDSGIWSNTNVMDGGIF